MKKAKLASAIGGAMFAALISGNAPGATSVNDNLPVAAQITASCVITAVGTLDFTGYDPVTTHAASPRTSTGSISVKCTKGSAGVTIDLNEGGHVGTGQRRMLGGTNGDFLPYNIIKPSDTTPYSDCSGGNFWGTTVTGGTIYSPTVTWASNAARVFTVCGSIPAGQNVSADASYTDTVVIDVSF
jgi:spore coat protein U-like protein